jgi:cobalt-zinc-cadmium efflux system membrane fusion protein
MSQEDLIETTAYEPPPPSEARGLAGRIVRQVPTVLALALLVGIGWWGHHNHWTIGQADHDGHQHDGHGHGHAQDDWCTEHSVPESVCIACKPQLSGANPADWCKEHGLPESRCTICHPEILQRGVAGDWCAPHGLPESSCTLCNEQIGQMGPAPTEPAWLRVIPTTQARPTSAPWRPDVATVRAALADAPPPTSQPGRNPQTCQTHARRVQFASVASLRKAGIQLAQATTAPVSATLRANAELDYDRTRMAHVASPAAGRAVRVDKEIGQAVRAGEVLALVDAAEVGKAKADLLEAGAALAARNKTLARLQQSTQSGFRTEVELQEAQAAVHEASARLFNAQQALANLGLAVTATDWTDIPAAHKRIALLGLPPALVASLEGQAISANLVPLAAPLDGIVIGREVVAGERVDPSKPAFVIADTRRLWVNIDLSPADAARVRLGQSVVFHPDATPDRTSTGQINWISTAVDDQTRTVRVRAVVANAAGRLLARSFGQAAIAIRQTPVAVVVPSEAVVFEGCCYMVFVRSSDTIFQARKVRLGASANGLTEILIGVLPGEVVVSTGSQVLKAEILKANLGAGCGGD